MKIEIITQDRHSRSVVEDIPDPVIDLTRNQILTLCLMQPRADGGEPGVLIISSDDIGTAVLQTSLREYLSASLKMIEHAEKHWGYTRPEGFESLEELRASLRKTINDLLEDS